MSLYAHVNATLSPPSHAYNLHVDGKEPPMSRLLLETLEEEFPNTKFMADRACALLADSVIRPAGASVSRV